jgi:uncharacterized protein YcfJ
MRVMLLAGVTALTLTGLSVPASHAQDALGGAIVGGATGAAIGGAVGGGRGAAIGAGVGAATGGERRAYRGSRAEYVVRERPGYRVRTCWRNDFGERVCRYRSRY